MPAVELVAGSGLPNDRAWALLMSSADTQFNPATPVWLHKSNFMCAFNANDVLGEFETSYEDKMDVLKVWRRSTGQRRPLLTSRLTDPLGCARVEAFFTKLHGSPVQLVCGLGPHKGFHFGNTAKGFKHDPSGSVIHIVNAATIASLSAAVGEPLEASRFRPNIVLQDVPAWEEFDWVGGTITLGDATLEVLHRTVRCAATHEDPRSGSGAPTLDIPGLLSKHFPQHGPYLGVYARVVSGGSVRVGDAVTSVRANGPPTPTGRDRHLIIFSVTVCILLAVLAWLIRDFQ